MCPSENRGYSIDRTDAGDMVLPQGTVAVAVALPVFLEPTTCYTIVIGLRKACKVPTQGYTLFVFDTENPTGSTPVGGTLGNVTPYSIKAAPSPNTVELRFAHTTKHEPGMRPVIGIASAAICPAGFDRTCASDSVSALVNISDKWSETFGVDMYIGFENCTPTKP